MPRTHCLILIAFTSLFFASSRPASAADKLKLLLIDGQNNHDWESTSPILKKTFEDSGRFTVDIATSPPEHADMSGFRPKFANYDVVVSNYNGDRWPKATENDFVDYLRRGHGFVAVHAANNAFAEWPEYNEAIGLGGWFGRSDKSGPYVYYKNNQLVTDNSPGHAGSHGQQHEFIVQTRNAEHPITKGLPQKWLHTKDELYDSLRGPAKNMEVLATAYSDPKTGGTGRDEPMLMVLEFGDGRVFHTTLGHADYSMNCIGFITTLLRGAEWAATGKVTMPVPKDFPTAKKTSSRK
jgi:type 1 glutamine amidotransferase